MTIEYALYKDNKDELQQITPYELMNYPKNEKDFIKENLYCPTHGCGCSITFAEPRETSGFHPQFKTFKNKDHIRTCAHYFLRRPDGIKYYPNQQAGGSQTKNSNSKSNNSLLKNLFDSSATAPLNPMTAPRSRNRNRSVINSTDGQERPTTLGSIVDDSTNNSKSNTLKIRKKGIHEITAKDAGKQRRTIVKVKSIDLVENQTPVINATSPEEENKEVKIYLPDSFFATTFNDSSQVLEFIASIKRYVEDNTNTEVYIVSIMEVVSAKDSLIELSILNSDFPEFTTGDLGTQKRKFYLASFVSLIATGVI